MNRSKRMLTAPRFAGLLVLIAAGSFAFRYFSGDHKDSGQIWTEFKVVRSAIRVRVLSPGVVEPQNRLEIKPPIAGRMEEVLSDEGQGIKKGQILAWMSSTERAALLDAARARGDAELKRWGDFYKATPVIAPIDGTLIARNVEPGQTFTSQDAVFVMSDRLTIKAQVDETDIARVHLEQPAEITLDAYPADIIPGKVEKIAFDAKTVNNVTTYTVDVLPEHIPDFMRSGMTASVNFAVESRNDVLSLDSRALRTRDGQPYVLLPPFEALGQPREQFVKLGVSDGKTTEILQGLADGQVVLVSEPKPKEPKTTNPFMPPRPTRK